MMPKAKLPISRRRGQLLLFVAIFVLFILGNWVSRSVSKWVGHGITYRVGDVLLIEDDVQGMLVATGETIHIVDGVQINGQLLAIGTDLHIDGEVLGDVTLLGETVQADLTAHGQSVLAAETVTLNGQFDGDVLAMATTLTLSPSVTTSGRVIGCYETLANQAGASVADCEYSIVRDQLRQTILGFSQLSWLTLTRPKWLTTLLSPFPSLGNGLWFIAMSAFLTLLFPQRFAHARESLRQRPIRVVLIGLCILLLLLGISALGTLLVVYIPISAIGVLPILGLAWAVHSLLQGFGWSVVVYMLGHWINLNYRKHDFPPFIESTVGGLSLFLLLLFMGWLPFGGRSSLVLILVLSMAGAGAVVFSRLGTRTQNR
ncbi:MAG: hypothetical protein ACOYLB_09050 [Phototrophicaceae bacterium]